MIIKRAWAPDYEVSDRWNIPAKIAKHRIYLFWSDQEVFPCDKTGIRIPDGFSDAMEKYEKSKKLSKIFCFGGSTTFGSLVSYDASYPSLMETMLKDTAVFNFGLLGQDFKGSMYLMIELLRWGMVPDTAIFLDGINEKQAWFQASSGNEEYEETTCDYGFFQKAILPDTHGITTMKKFTFSSFMELLNPRNKTNLFSGGSQKTYDIFKFVSNQAAHYIKTYRVIKKIAETWSMKAKFLLQPTVWDVWKEGHDKRYDYLKALYRSIISKSDEDVIDLSEHYHVEKEVFIDWQHLTPKGNMALAEAVIKELRIG